MGWGQEAAERIQQHKNQRLTTLLNAGQAARKIASSADGLWWQLVEQIEIDVQDFCNSCPESTGLQCLRLNSNNLTLLRGVQPILKLEIIRSPGSHILIELYGMTGSLGRELHAGPEHYRFGLDDVGKPTFVRDDGRPISPAGISRQVGLVLEEFFAKYF